MSQSKITHETVLSKNACQEGYIWFLRKFGHGPVTYNQLYDAVPECWKDWVRDNFKEYEPKTHEDYKGRFVVGQRVYIDHYGMGSWRATVVHQIDRNNNGVGFHCMVQADTPGRFYCLQEESVFASLAELKLYWIRKIVLMTEDE